MRRPTTALCWLAVVDALMLTETYHSLLKAVPRPPPLTSALPMVYSSPLTDAHKALRPKPAQDVRAPSRKNPTSSGSGSGGTFRARVGIFFCVFFSFQILKNFFYYHYLYYRAGLILTKNPVARKDSNYISVVPIVILSSLRFFCTC